MSPSAAAIRIDGARGYSFPFAQSSYAQLPRLPPEARTSSAISAAPFPLFRATSIVVTRGDRTLRCAIGDRSPSVGQIGVGDRSGSQYRVREISRYDGSRLSIAPSSSRAPLPATSQRSAMADHHGRGRQGDRCSSARSRPTSASWSTSSRSADAWRCGATAPREPSATRPDTLPAQPAEGDDEPRYWRTIRGLPRTPTRARWP